MSIIQVPFIDGDGTLRRMRMSADSSGYLVPSPPALAETKTEADLDSGTVVFTEPVDIISIDNKDSENDGTFVVSGQTIRLSPGGSWTGAILYGGALSATVTVTGSTKFDLQRFK